MDHSVNYREKIVNAFNQFSPENLGVLEDFYDVQAVFEDPVTKATGLEAIRKYYLNVYKNVEEIHFDFQEIHSEGDIYFASWIMTLRVPPLNFGKSYQVQGLSKIQFNASGKVMYHRDYLDLGAMVYEKIPLFGSAITQIKNRLKHQ